MTETMKDTGTYRVSLTHHTLGVTLSVESIESSARYTKDLTPDDVVNAPSYDIAFHVNAKLKAHPIHDLEYIYGPELAFQMLIGIFKVSEMEFNAFMDINQALTPRNIFATMGAAHDALAMALTKLKMELGQ